MMRITETVKQLIIINVIFYICSQFLVEPAYRILALHFPLNPDFGVWQLFTSMFMHAPMNSGMGITHILFNMLGLWMFGSPLEHFWGTKKFLFFYISCGLGAAGLEALINYLSFNNAIQPLLVEGLSKSQIISSLAKEDFTLFQGKISQEMFNEIAGPFYGQMVGASGALYGVMVAFAFMFPTAELMLIFLPIPIKAKYFVPGLLCIDLFLGLKGQSIFGFGDDGIAHFAHLGGALIGFIMMWYWRKNNFNNRRWN